MSIKKSALYNLAGGGVPALMALATIPIIVHGLGEDGYGIFILVTAIIGYFALLDINVTAGSVKYLSEYAAKNDESRIDQTITLGLLVYVLIGLVGALLILGAAGFLVEDVFHIPDALHGIAFTSLQIAAAGFLFGQIQSYLQSVPQALLRYDVSARLEMGFGIALPLATVALLLFGYGLVEIIVLRVLASVLNCLLLWRSIRKLFPDFAWRRPQRSLVRSLLEFSAFSFLSKVAALTYAHADKLIIGAFVGMKPLAYYTVAATLANRVLGLLYRLSAVLFPASSAMAARGEHDKLERLYLKASRYIFYLNASVLVLMVAFADPILHYWIGAEFAREGAIILQIVALAQFVDALTNIPSLVNDGMGHPRVTGSFAMARALVGLAAIWFLVGQAGIQGAAWAHLASAGLMTTLFVTYVHGRTVPCTLGNLLGKAYAIPTLGILLIGSMVAILMRHAEPGLAMQLIAMSLGSILLVSYGLTWVIEPGDRGRLYSLLRGLWARRT